MARRATSFSAALKQVLAKPFSRYGDRQLLERFVESGDELAFGAIVDRHGPMLLSLCRRHVGDAHAAEDVLQATFLVLARNAHSILKRESVAGWLHGVAQRLARQARLAETARSRREKRAGAERSQTAAGDPAWDELLLVLDEELQKLAERHRLPLLLCYLEGRTQDEAARQLGWSLSTLRRRLEEGRELLKTRLTRRGATLGAGLFAGFLAPSAVRAALTTEVRHAVLMAATGSGKGVAVSASVLALANGALRMSIFTKMFICAAAATVVCAAGAGAVWQMGPATKAAKSRQPAHVQGEDGRAHARQEPQKKEPLPGRDLFGDALPKGAVARLGTVAFRHGTVNVFNSLTFSKDGKHLVSASSGFVRRWDLVTGQASINLGGWGRGGIGADMVAANKGLVFLIGFVPAKEGKSWEWRYTQHDLDTGKTRVFPLEFPPKALNDNTIAPTLVSPDATTFAQLSNDKKGVYLWSAVTGSFMHYLKPQQRPYTALAFSPDGRTIFLGDEAHKIVAFDVATAKELRSFGIANGTAVDKMAISPDGKWLATIGKERKQDVNAPNDRFMRLWDLSKGSARILGFPDEDFKAKSILFTADNRTVIAGLEELSGQFSVRCWEIDSSKSSVTWTCDARTVVNAAISPDGQTLATINISGVIQLWDWATGKEIRPILASPCGLQAVAFRPDGKTVVTVGQDIDVREWDVATGRMLSSQRSLGKGFYPTLSPGGKYLAFSKEANVVPGLYDAATGKLVLARISEVSPSLVFSRDDKQVVEPADFNTFVICDIKTGKVIHTLALPQATPEAKPTGWNYEPRPAAIGAGGKSLILYGDAVTVWDLQSSRQISSWNMLEKKVLKRPAVGVKRYWEGITAKALSADGSKIAFCVRKDKARYDDGPFTRLVVLKTATGEILHQNDLEERDTFRQFTLSPDGNRLALGDGPNGRTVRVWTVGNVHPTFQFKGHRGPINALAFSPDGKRLASASEDSTVLVWDLAK